jgi:hypothetical protein
MSDQVTFTPDEIKGLECKHVTYTAANDGGDDDLLTIKEVVHFKDGRSVPHIRQIKNFPRHFWVTKEGWRNHKDKKEAEKLERLQRFPTTQNRMLRDIARALGRGRIEGGLRQAAKSPYLYGCDISTMALAKQRYMAQYPTSITANSVAVFDIEQDVVEGTEQPIMASLTFKDKAILVVTRRFLKTITKPEAKIISKFEEYLCQYGNLEGASEDETKTILTIRNRCKALTVEIQIVDDIADGIVEVFKKAHEWKPDFVAIWNINYDLPKILAELERAGHDPADVFSDPSVPVRFRYFKYKEGPAVKVTASGKSMTLAPAERWHVATCPASFYFIDAMCVYQKIRIAKGKESYALDAVLKKHKLGGKLKFDQADHVTGLAWHMFMQRNFPIEYCVYNLFDCISVELLDEKTNDLARTISSLCGYSEYSIFSSQPRRTCNNLHFFFQEKGLVIATTSNEMRDENDDRTIGLKDWIVTLPSFQVANDAGLRLIEECPEIHTLGFAMTADLDVSGTYPNLEMALNISKKTTKRELCEIIFKECQDPNERRIEAHRAEHVRRMQGINLTGGTVNAVQFCVEMYSAPSFTQMSQAFNEEIRRAA